MRKLFNILASVMIAILLTGCGGGGDSAAPNTPDPGFPISSRPYQLKIPANYDPGSPTALIVLLHGYSSNSNEVANYFGLIKAADSQGFLLAYPDGTIDSRGNRYWNGTDACCAFDPDPADDVSYLTSVMDDIAAKYNVDPNRIYFVGHSNGAFMSNRMACEHSSRIAAIVTLAGMQWNDPRLCPTTKPVSVLHIHGDLDDTIFFDGGNVFGTLSPSAFDSTATWAAKDGCTGNLIDLPPNIDLESVITGDETRVQRYTGCPAGIDVELWTITGGSHIPTFSTNIADLIWNFLSTHPKP